ncbi:MAG: SMP-30/gluconolactonase/LRE family protein [Pseudomonas sp.]|nr:SMP-30/gluconolactonase/LRE family protein [Pseudomonas sp.]
MKSIEPKIEVLTSGLGFIEGPLIEHDVIYLCDIQAGLIKKVVGGKASILANVGGGPNGLAFGPQGYLYVANNGGSMRWKDRDWLILSHGFECQGYDSRIERIDLSTLKVKRVVDQVNGHRFEAIDDLLFDPRGGIWFTDLGRDGHRSRTYGGVYWFDEFTQECREVAYPLPMGANGIGLSPDNTRLYATEYGAGRLWSWGTPGAGELDLTGNSSHGGKLLWQAPDAQLLDSLAVAPNGNIFIASQPHGVFSVFSPAGEHLVDLRKPEHFPTNLCFDPKKPNVAYATLSSTGTLAKIQWDESAF